MTSRIPQRKRSREQARDETRRSLMYTIRHINVIRVHIVWTPRSIGSYHHSPQKVVLAPCSTIGILKYPRVSLSRGSRAGVIVRDQYEQSCSYGNMNGCPPIAVCFVGRTLAARGHLLVSFSTWNERIIPAAASLSLKVV